MVENEYLVILINFVTEFNLFSMSNENITESTLNSLKSIVCELFDIDPNDPKLFHTKERKYVDVKDIMVYILHEHYKWSYHNIFSYFYKYERSAQKAIYRVRGYVKYDKKYNSLIQHIISKL